MKKLRIYIETSAISNLEQPTNPIVQQDMRDLWLQIKDGKYDVIISSVTIGELADIADVGKRDILSSFLDEIDFEFAEYEKHMEQLVKSIIQNEILTDNHIRDCQHLACAIDKKCDCIVTYNMRHMHKITTVKGVRALSILHNGNDIDIVKAETLLDKGDEYDS